MDWFQSLISGDSGTATQMIVITLILVVALILIVWLFRRIATAPKKRAAANSAPRLSVTDVFAVDDKRFLVLVRRDSVEHLVMIGGPTDVVVESGITHSEFSAHREHPHSTHAVQEPMPEAIEPVSGMPAAPAVAAATVTAATVAAANEASAEPQAPETPPSPEVEMVSAEPEPAIETTMAEPAASAELDETVDVTADIETGELVQTEEQGAEVVVNQVDGLEAAISENLEEALAIDGLDTEEGASGGEVSVEPQLSDELIVESVDPDAPADDEMQKLLDELATEKKEPAE